MGKFCIILSLKVLETCVFCAIYYIINVNKKNEIIKKKSIIT